MFFIEENEANWMQAHLSTDPDSAHLNWDRQNDRGRMQHQIQVAFFYKWKKCDGKRLRTDVIRECMKKSLHREKHIE